MIPQVEIETQKGYMVTSFFRGKFLFLVFVVFLIPASVFAETGAQKLAAIEGGVYGNVQEVGFRAFIFKQAIRYNLGGSIENQPDGSVHFTLQGPPVRLDEALMLIKQGPEKATVTDVKVAVCLVRKDITFVVVKGWTSKSRDFDHPVDLVYSLRPEDEILSDSEAGQIFKKIIRAAMPPADRAHR